MSDYTTDTIDTSRAPRRPVFLTVLCVLTFVVSGYNFIMSLVGLFTSRTYDPDQLREGMEQMQQSMEGADPQMQKFLLQIMTAFQDMIQTGVAHASALSTGELAAAGLSLLGAFWMFRLQKKGFYIYVIAKIIGVFVPLIIFGFNLLTIILYGFVAVIGVLFIVLYNMNRKYMH